jgi:serine/threonine-protein kinase
MAALEAARSQILAGQAPPAHPTAAFGAIPEPVPADPTVLAVAPQAVEHEVAYVAGGRDDILVEEERRWPWAILVTLLVAAAIIGLVLLLSGGKKVRVPSVVKLRSSAAAAVLHRAGLEVEIDNVTSDAPRGIVISQDPVAGTRVKEDSTVSLSVSEGPGARQVPDVEDLGRRAARRALTDAGFKGEERDEESEDIAKNHVIRTSPGSGVQLDIGSTVTIFVSTGAPQVEVPDVVGQKLDDARSTLQDAGFRVTTTSQPSADHDPGTVLSQSPPAGGEADKGSSVQLTVARQPEEVDVPDVTGETDTDAIRILSGAGFEVNTQREDVPTEDGDGVVLSQRPSGGRKAKPGSEVTITIGRFVAPEPAPTEPDGATE